MKVSPRFVCPLDPAFQPAELWNRAYERKVASSPRRERVVLGVEREDGRVGRMDVTIADPADAETIRYVERLVKFMLWGWGGWRVYVGGPASLAEAIGAMYRKGGARGFDADLMGGVYERGFEVVACAPEGVPTGCDAAVPVGGHLDGCRLGFDLGASDFKLAAVRDGEVVFTEEMPWTPRDQADPAYHYGMLNEGLRRAASHLPRVDAIGGSSAGVIVQNRIMVASLLRSVPPDRFAEARDMFLRIGREWGVPLEVANDGDVTALTGAMGLGVTAILGVAMGSSEAAGYLDRAGRLRGLLAELAFAPVDYAEGAPADEWSGDRGVGAMYFSQQAAGRLLAPAGIDVAAGMPLPERLKHVQALMAAGDPRAARIYETIGIYLGYSLPHYARFFDIGTVMVLGRVTTGAGGDIVVSKAREVLANEFPEVAARLRVEVPDEKTRRVGQAVAAASLPALKTTQEARR